MKTALTLAAAKTAAVLSRKLKRGNGGALPGLVAERLNPDVGRQLAAQLPHGVILVTGTNGKTTTTKMIAAALTASGEQVLTNASGSNLRRGVLSSLIDATDRRGKIHASIALFEVDEASLRLVVPLVEPTKILVLNLFRDQLDRYGELDTTAAMIGRGIKNSKADLYLNADDPLVASLAKYSARADQVHYFGLEALPASGSGITETVSDSDRCPICGTRLIYARQFYGHLGHYSCPTGDFRRPQPDVAVTNVDQLDDKGTTYTVAVESKRYDGTLALPGTYNLYNAIAALSVVTSSQIPVSKILSSLAQTPAAFGRVERVNIGENRTIMLLLIKNPAGFSQVLETFIFPIQNPQLLIIVNDLAADGRDVSWLWDVEIEPLARLRPRVVVAGLRAVDIALRLKYAGITEVRIAHTIAAGIIELKQGMMAGQMSYVLPTYTALAEVRRELGRTVQIAVVPQ